MELTLLDILKYLKKKYKIFFLLLILGVFLAVFSNLPNTEKKNIRFAILNDQLFWESGIKDNYNLGNIRNLRVADKYLSFIETVKLGLDTKIENTISFNKNYFSKVNCERGNPKKILICKHILDDEYVDNFIKENNLIINSLFNDEINSLIKGLSIREKVVSGEFKEETLIAIRLAKAEVIEFKDSYIENVTHKVRSIKSDYFSMTLISFGPAFLYLILVIIFFPRLIKSRNK
jgi:hypothetical protein